MDGVFMRVWIRMRHGEKIQVTRIHSTVSRIGIGLPVWRCFIGKCSVRGQIFLLLSELYGRRSKDTLILHHVTAALLVKFMKDPIRRLLRTLKPNLGKIHS